MRRLRRVITLATLVAASPLLTARQAHAADCSPVTHLATCIEPDNFWARAGTAEFTFLGGARTIAPGRLGFALATTYLARPLVLVLPSASTAGAEALGVDRLWNTTALFSFGLTSSLELNLALPFTTYRTGTGLSAIASQHSTPLSFTALRDTRIGVTLALLPRARAFQLASRWELSVPTGDASAFAGDRSFVGVPSFVASWRDGPFVASAELGARLRRPTELLGSRVGSQMVVGLGAGADLLDQRLGVRFEILALPTFEAQHSLALMPG